MTLMVGASSCFMNSARGVRSRACDSECRPTNMLKAASHNGELLPFRYHWFLFFTIGSTLFSCSSKVSSKLYSLSLSLR